MNDIPQALFCYGKDNLTLKTALHECQNLLQGAVALLYSIEKCQFAKVGLDSSLLDSRDRVIPIEFGAKYIFEARVFNSVWELRWLNQNNGIGRAALISEGASSELLELNWQNNPPLEYLESLPQQYLLWGQKTDAAADKGWQKLSSARIGTLAIPLEQEIAKNHRVYLKTQEYLAEIDSNGNVAIAEERLIALEVK